MPIRAVILSLAATLLTNCASILPVSSSLPAPVLNDTDFTSFDGDRFPYRKWLPGSEPDLVIVGFHGIAGAADDYRNLADHFRRHLPKAAVYAPNLRGQGNDPRESRRGDIHSSDEWLLDARTFSRLVQDRHPEATLVWCGESMGSLIALHALTTADGDSPPCEAIVLASPVTRIPGGLPPGRLALLRAGAFFFPRARISLESLGGQDAVHVTRDAVHQEQVETNPYHVPDFTLRLLANLSGMIESAPDRAGEVTVPTLLLHAGKDVFSTPDAISAFETTFPDSTPVARHLYPESYHLLFYDHQREAVLADLTAWLRTL